MTNIGYAGNAEPSFHIPTALWDHIVAGEVANEMKLSRFLRYASR